MSMVQFVHAVGFNIIPRQVCNCPGVARRMKRPRACIDALSGSRSVSSYADASNQLESLEQEVNLFRPEIEIEMAETPPASWYTQPAFHELEAITTFRQNLIAVGSIFQLSKPRSYFTGRLGNHPFVVLRDSDLQIRAFYNVCRHKGMRLAVQECGLLDANRLACTYHGWQYQLDGRLSKATRINGIKDWNAKRYGLVSIPLRIWGPLIFLAFDKKTSEAENASGQSLENLQPLLNTLEEKHGFSEGLRHMRRRTYSVNCNWKVVIDNYCDNAYHVPYAHRGLGSNLDLDSYMATVHDGFSIQTCTTSRTSSDRVGRSALYAHVHPNLMINRYGPWLDTNIVYPTSPTSCEIVFDYFLEESFIAQQPSPEATEQFVRESLQSSDEVQQEDTYLCENVQVGLESAAYDRGRYAPKVEFPDWHFHCHLAKELKGGIEQMYKRIRGSEQAV